MEVDAVFNLSDRDAKLAIQTKLGAAQGPHTVTVKPYRPNRSSQANRFYFGAVVKTLREFNAEQGVFLSSLQTHEFIKKRVIPVPVMDPRTGEVIDEIGGETHGMDRPTFNHFVQGAKKWVEDYTGAVIPDADGYYAPEPEAKQNRRGRAA